MRNEGDGKMATIGIGADDAAFGLKQKLFEYLEARGYMVLAKAVLDA